MRTLILLLILVCGFGAAALWQQTRLQRLREERAIAGEISAGNVARTQSGLLGKEEGVVVIGRPAGNPAATAGESKGAEPPANPALPQPAPVPAPAPPPGDFVMAVSAGQSLSQIAHDHYGHAPVDLVTKLAKYNGLEDADGLRPGMQLKLPTLERLGVVLKK
ncbi:MAG: LysM domain-containing protein [Planctomycetota bacterium]